MAEKKIYGTTANNSLVEAVSQTKFDETIGDIDTLITAIIEGTDIIDELDDILGV